MTWRPMSDQHAIERVRLVCIFTVELRPKLVNRLADLFEAKREEFSFGLKQESQSEGFMLEIGPNGPVAPKPTKQVGWSFQRKTADGSIAESLSLQASALVYETVEYTDWSSFHARALNIVYQLVEELSTFDDIAVISLEYNDRFIFQGAPEASDPRPILEINDELIPAKALEDGNLWHIHRGWFEAGSKGKLLVNQNLDAQDGQFNGNPARSVSVFTKLEARQDIWELTLESLTTDLPEMHTRSKKVLETVLKADTVKMIGMNK